MAFFGFTCRLCVYQDCPSSAAGIAGCRLCFHYVLYALFHVAMFVYLSLRRYGCSSYIVAFFITGIHS